MLKRYSLYLAFTLVASIFWILYFTLVLGFVPGPVPYHYLCQSEGIGCPPPPGLFERIFKPLSLVGSVPATIVAFIFFRRWVHRRLDKTEL